MRHRTFAVSLLLLGVLAACGSTGGGGPDAGPGAGGAVTKAVPAAQGGVLTTGGATLTIAAGALSRDATVTLDVHARPVTPDSDPMKSAGPAVAVDLGGATLQAPATLDLPATEDTTAGSVVVLETRPGAEPGEPLLRVHAARPAPALVTAPGEQALTAARASATAVFRHALTRSGIYTPHVIPRPRPSELTGGKSLQVPFYYQAGLPWCTPTSLAMTLNYYEPLVTNDKFPSGFASNWGLASALRQGANSGSSGSDVLAAAGVPDSKYRFMAWDAELVPSDGAPSDATYNPFVSYLALATTGVFGLATPRPVWTASDRQVHAFVVTGVTSNGLYINNSNDLPGYDWAGHHRQQTLAEFRAANCTLKDKADPSKGCLDSAPKPDLYTLLFDAPVKPETKRRGSLMLSHGQTLYFSGVPVGFYDSFVLQSPAFQTLAAWGWDGTYPNGYYFSDGASYYPQFPPGSNLPQNTTFRTSLFRSTSFEMKGQVVNVTDVALTYGIDARLETVSGASVTLRHQDLLVSPYSASTLGVDFGRLASAFPGIAGTFDARLTLTLTQDGVVQDVKVIEFSVAPDPTTPPEVRILVPLTPTTLLKGVPFTFQGEGFDAHTLPDGKPQLAWTEGGAVVGAGPSYTLTPATAGTRTLTLVATGEYGTRASASVTVTVIDPTLTPGQISIVQPLAGTAFYSPTTNQPIVNVPLVGAATYSDGTPVPGERLVWTAQAQGDVEREVGRGASVTAPLGGGRNSPLPYVIRLTVLSDTGAVIGSTTVNISVAFTYIG